MHYLEEELYASVRNDRRIFDFLQAGSLDGLWYWDLKSPEDEWMNTRFWEVLGYDPAEMPHKAEAWQHLIHPDDRDLALENFHRHAADPSYPYDQIVRYQHRTGKTVWVRCRGLIVRDDEGKPSRMLGAHTEVTDLMLAEQRLAATNQRLLETNSALREANEELDHFAWAASHDLKAPLRGIVQLVGWIREDLAEGSLDSVGEHLDFLEARADRLQTLLADLLYYTRVGRDIQDKDIQSVSLAELCQETWELCDHDRFELMLEGDLPTLYTPAPLLQQVLMNLFSNSIAHHDRGQGMVTVRAQIEEELVVIQVEDDGPGVPEKFQERVFELFQQLQARDTKEGSGIGLAIVRRGVKRAGGEATMTNVGERGACVRFSWPLAWGESRGS